MEFMHKFVTNLVYKHPNEKSVNVVSKLKEGLTEVEPKCVRIVNITIKIL